MGLTAFLRSIAEQTKFSPNTRVREMELEDDWKRLEIVVPLEGEAAAESTQKNSETIKAILKSAEVALGGLQ